MPNPLILQVAVPKPLYNYFDYLAPPGIELDCLRPGIRLQVPFGNRKIIGMLLAITDSTEVPANKLKTVQKILDSTPVLPTANLKLLQWAASYYHHPIGEVIATALPKLLNKGASTHIQAPPNSIWVVTAAGQLIQTNKLPKNHHRQASLLALLQQKTFGMSEDELAIELARPLPILQALQKKGWATSQPFVSTHSTDTPLQLNLAQNKVVKQVCTKLHQFYPALLDGVTGSGKTEVYLQIIQKVLEQNCQALVLVPEINLTPQMLTRFHQRFAVPIAVLHSKLSAKERLHTWLLARDGIALIVIGTRSAIWTPLARPGIFIVDEEHDSSYKQQDHFRYSARDIAVVRAQHAQVPVLLGSATPSLDSLHNVSAKSYAHFVLPERAGTATHPSFHIVNMRRQPKRINLSRQLIEAIKQCLAKQQQILLFINQRGYAPILICYKCGWIAHCKRCDTHLPYHKTDQNLRCHYCGDSHAPNITCPKCQHSDLHLLGQGTERIEEQLQKQFPTARVLRVDSDSTRRKDAMNTVLELIHAGEADILVGTQMLAKGHHFPNVTLVGIINIDGGLYGADFRDTERMAQLIIQVAGRAGRAEHPGTVIIQTHHPNHPLLNRLVKHGYTSFTQAALEERQQADFPPFARLALLRAEATNNNKPAMDFLTKAKLQAKKLNYNGVQLWGPVVAPMEKRADWYRAQLLLKASKRKILQQLLSQWLPTLQPLSSSKVRWSLDVDPQDLL